MDIYYILGLLVPNITTTYILFNYLHKVYEAKYSKKFYAICYLGVVCAQSGMIFLKLSYLSLLVFVISVGVLTVFGFESELKNKTLYTVMYVIYLVFLDIASVHLFA